MSNGQQQSLPMEWGDGVDHAVSDSRDDAGGSDTCMAESQFYDRPSTGSRTDLAQLLRETPYLWRGGERGPISRETMDSGHAALNELLPGGWPRKSVIEIVVDEWGSGELQVLLPLMADLSCNRSRLSLVCPPYLPYAPALHNAGIALDRLVIVDSSVSDGDRWWCAEKILRHPECGLMMVWPERPRPESVRRLQSAAEAGNSTGVIFHRGEPVDTAVSLRLKTHYCPEGISVSLLKSRYSWHRGSVIIPVSGTH